MITATKGGVIAVHDATHTLLNENNATTISFYTYVGVTSEIAGGTKALLPTGKPVYDTQLQIDYYRPVRNDRLLFSEQGTGMRWDDTRTVDYLSSRLRAVFPEHLILNPVAPCGRDLQSGYFAESVLGGDLIVSAGGDETPPITPTDGIDEAAGAQCIQGFTNSDV